MTKAKGSAKSKMPACMKGLSGFCGPFYPIIRTVREEVFFPSLKPERVKGGFEGFRGFGIPVWAVRNDYFPVTAQFKTEHGGDIWVLCPDEDNALGFAPFFTRGCVAEWDIEHIANKLRRELNNAAARARRKTAKKHKRKKE